ncbi:BspA family leucine-rich repeat surface protein [Francisella uliginis]|uniref:BspA family leucine-rich repeat surface protein n=1 Tax=Francisella uliginis TaxID=573570 RepID=A0A1L4BSL0_9GAMM|nr:BspA family leucine-rich repeat surface protein [Francisella uliginis]API86831.1 hypothetical protein F7310_05450 [Francisella uliginis]
MSVSKRIATLALSSLFISLTGCETVTNVYNEYNPFQEAVEKPTTFQCPKKEVGVLIKNGLGNSYTLVVDDISIRDGNVTNLLRRNIPFIYKGKKINHICTTHVTDMSNLFENAKEVDANITDFDTSNVTDMSYMFAHAETFNQPIGVWNTSSVTNMDHMFYRARLFNQPLKDWNVFSVRNMDYMFPGTYKFNQPLNTWNVFNVTSHAHFTSPTSGLDPEFKPNFLVFTFSVNLATNNKKDS